MGVAKSFRRSDDVNHDIISVHDGDYWRLLTPGEYEIIAVADGYEPVAKLVEVTDNGHDTAPVVNFELRKIDLEDNNINPEPLTNMDYPSNSDYLEPLVDENTLQNLYDPMYYTDTQKFNKFNFFGFLEKERDEKTTTNLMI